MNDDERRARIRQLNDGLRRGHQNGRIQATSGVNAMGVVGLMAVMEAVACFGAFSPGDDPCGEHDFGCVEVCGQQVFWKIDYYDPSLTRHADDPADPATCVRVMTLMLPSEY